MSQSSSDLFTYWPGQLTLTWDNIVKILLERLNVGLLRFPTLNLEVSPSQTSFPGQKHCRTFLSGGKLMQYTYTSIATHILLIENQSITEGIQYLQTVLPSQFNLEARTILSSLIGLRCLRFLIILYQRQVGHLARMLLILCVFLVHKLLFFSQSACGHLNKC